MSCPNPDFYQFQAARSGSREYGRSDRRVGWKPFVTISIILLTAPLGRVADGGHRTPAAHPPLVLREPGRGKNRFKIKDLSADERRTRPISDFHRGS